MALNAQAKFAIGVLVVPFLIVIAFVVWTMNVTNNLQEEIDYLTEDFARYEPNPMPIGVVDRANGAEILEGSTCFDKDVVVAVTESTETWSFVGGVTPEGFQSIYSAPDLTTLYGGDGLTLDADNCLVFSDRGFRQGIPAKLAEHMRRMPATPLTMAFQITLEATDLTDPDNQRRTGKTILRSTVFTIPAAS